MSVIASAASASAPAASAPSASDVKRPCVVTHPEEEKPFGRMLGDLHKSLLVKEGVMHHRYPNHKRFPTPAGAKQLAEKWSRSFQDKRDDFKKAGLWVRIFIDSGNKSIKVTVEKNKESAAEIATPVPFCPPLPPCPPPVSDEAMRPPMHYGFPMQYGVPYGTPMSFGAPPMPYGFPMPFGAPPMHYGFPMPYGAQPMHYGFPMPYGAPPLPHGAPEYSEEENQEPDA